MKRTLKVTVLALAVSLVGLLNPLPANANEFSLSSLIPCEAGETSAECKARQILLVVERDVSRMDMILFRIERDDLLSSDDWVVIRSLETQGVDAALKYWQKIRNMPVEQQIDQSAAQAFFVVKTLQPILEQRVQEMAADFLLPDSYPDNTNKNTVQAVLQYLHSLREDSQKLINKLEADMKPPGTSSN